MTESAASRSKILFRVANDDGSTNVETLWATSLGEDAFELDNSPFYAYGVSWKDVVFAPFDSTEGFPSFQNVIHKSGHRTVRLIFDPPVEDGNSSDLILQGLVSLGCTYEGANRGFMSIDIPAGVDLENVRIYLVDSKASWEHADPTYEALFPFAS